MSGQLVMGPDVAAWVYEATGGAVGPTTQAVGYLRDGALIVGCAVEGYNGNNIYGHFRCDKAPPRHYWKALASYIFNDLGCTRLTGPVAASNTKARKLDEHIGFELEATLKGAAEDGGDMLLYVLWKDKCRFLNW